jgi:hypothetical protein
MCIKFHPRDSILAVGLCDGSIKVKATSHLNFSFDLVFLATDVRIKCQWPTCHTHSNSTLQSLCRYQPQLNRVLAYPSSGQFGGRCKFMNRSMMFPPLREKYSSYPYLLGRSGYGQYTSYVCLVISCLLSLPG